MLYKLKREIKGWRKSAFCPYLHWQVTLNIFVYFFCLCEFSVSFNWLIFFLILFPNISCLIIFYWMLDILLCWVLDISYS